MFSLSLQYVGLNLEFFFNVEQERVIEWHAVTISTEHKEIPISDDDAAVAVTSGWSLVPSEMLTSRFHWVDEA